MAVFELERDLSPSVSVSFLHIEQSVMDVS